MTATYTFEKTQITHKANGNHFRRMDWRRSDVRDPTDHEQRVFLIGEWLKRYASIYSLYGHTLADYPEKFEQFFDAFKDVAPTDMNYAFERTRAEYEGPDFPTPAMVLKRLRARETEIDQFHSEKAWADLRWTIDQFWYGPELGLQSLYVSKGYQLPGYMDGRVVTEPFQDGLRITAKPIDSRTAFAIRNVGGLH